MCLPPSNTLYSPVSHQNSSCTRAGISASLTDVHLEQGLAFGSRPVNVCGMSETHHYSGQESLPLNGEIFKKKKSPLQKFRFYFFLRRYKEETRATLSQLRSHPKIKGLLLGGRVVLIFLQCSVH